MSKKSLIINPGSTSTKIGVFEDETLLFEETLRHTTEEIARLLHIRKGTVKSRLHRARARLKESMRREGLLDE